MEDIKGIGKQTADLLLKEFRSVKRIKEASDEAIEKVVGKSKLKMIREKLNSDPN